MTKNSTEKELEHKKETGKIWSYKYIKKMTEARELPDVILYGNVHHLPSKRMI